MNMAFLIAKRNSLNTVQFHIEYLSVLWYQANATDVLLLIFCTAQEPNVSENNFHPDVTLFATKHHKTELLLQGNNSPSPSWLFITSDEAALYGQM